MKRFIPTLAALVVAGLLVLLMRRPSDRSPAAGGIVADPCGTDQPVNAAGEFCGVSVQFSQIAPADAFSEAGARFQSNPGHGESGPITITFSRPVASVSVTVYDATFDGNEMFARDASGSELGRAAFTGNHLPGALTTQTRRMDGAISSVLLVSAPLDYVAYSMVVRFRAGGPVSAPIVQGMSSRGLPF